MNKLLAERDFSGQEICHVLLNCELQEANWNTSKRDGRKWTRWSRQAKPRLMLAHPHCDPVELRKINGVEYDSYASAAEFCFANHQHPDDYYGTPNAEDRRPDPDEFEEEFHEPDLLEEDWLELARQLPDCPPSQEMVDLLGRRDIDIQYDWTPHVGRYADPGIVQGDYWRQRIAQNPLYMDVEDLPSEARDTLNAEQRIVYDTIVGHFQCESEEQILLHVDGGGGTGKSYLIKVLSSHLQKLARNRPSPIWRAAPTGVARNQIMGTTLHSLLRLPVDRAFTELSPADANALQKKLRDVSKKARVSEYNYEHLVRLKRPAIQVMAKNIGNGADKATSEQAGNLAGQFPSQSITVDKMVTDLSERYFQTGLSYVAVSRVKTLEGLMIDTPFERASLHYEKLPDGK
ncbi:PIF1-like helicase [Hirsutella rhossiliensis]